jgi:hypothetical protein
MLAWKSTLFGVFDDIFNGTNGNDARNKQKSVELAKNAWKEKSSVCGTKQICR